MSSGKQILYGANVVLPALMAQRRQIIRALVQRRNPELLGKRRPPPRQEIPAIQRLLEERNIPVVDAFRYELDRLTDGRPHNGLVLEVGELPIERAQVLGQVDLNAKTYELHPQGLMPMPIHRRSMIRPPLWIFMDGITDPQNVGSIIRTAHYLGVDGITLPMRDSPPLGGTVSKASAGALELMRNVFHVRNTAKFLHDCQANGWEVAAGGKRPLPDLVEDAPLPIRSKVTKALVRKTGPIGSRPTVLILGSEHKGLRPSLLPLIDRYLWIPYGGPILPMALRSDTTPSVAGAENGDRAAANLAQEEDPIESLNVNVAAGILVSHLLATMEGKPSIVLDS
ncbi:hypothetical protein AMAG_00613 [Allomyces macrogynus ATCC 38327]|uniref:rRNA methyltransferase 1, mitochondrial n=1 Tax=Allomyces macrogynus (strain ATCC 38327) TaxID=578462 RepID=A0A0L0RWE1_ALLM3|nr:hypothetical protein AMAG_00613 [Allomyces macrogynus ATCC 38327]|eukprot:KNE54653.1 hypothetical protein AMAG_00613 [Allomyces macrogynus ATCC 38327]